jgi:inhibitor of KinA
MSVPRLVFAGDAVLVAEFDERIDPVVNGRAIALAEALRDNPVPGTLDIVPTFRSVAVYFEPLATDVERLAARIREAAAVSRREVVSTAVVDVPVCYDAEFAPDILDVAKFGGVDAQAVMAMHSAPIYRVYMLGFVPGFAYLGTVDPRIAAPRRSEPRLKVPAGAVAIAGGQTGIYPRQTPGGWNIIGRTPLQMVALERTPPALLKAGDAVRFRSIDRSEFGRIAAEQEGSS